MNVAQNIWLLVHKLWGSGNTNTLIDLPLTLSNYFCGSATFLSWHEIPVAVSLQPGTNQIRINADTNNFSQAYFVVIGN